MNLQEVWRVSLSSRLNLSRWWKASIITRYLKPGVASTSQLSHLQVGIRTWRPATNSSRFGLKRHILSSTTFHTSCTQPVSQPRSFRSSQESLDHHRLTVLSLSSTRFQSQLQTSRTSHRMVLTSRDFSSKVPSGTTRNSSWWSPKLWS